MHAKRIQTKEGPIRRSLQGRRLGAYVDPRFKAEELAQDLTVTFFNFFLEDREGPSDPERRQVEPLVEASRKYLQVLPEVDTEEVEHVKAYVKEQIIVNFLQLQMLVWERNGGALIQEKECREVIECLADKVFGKERGTSVHFVRASNLVLFILICSSALFAPEAVGWDNLERADELLKRIREQRKSQGVMPYDNQKFVHFCRLVENALERSGNGR